MARLSSYLRHTRSGGLIARRQQANRSHRRCRLHRVACRRQPAAAAGVRPSIADPLRYVQMNVVGTAGALQLAARKGIRRFLYRSSSSVYGDSAAVPLAESDPAARPISPYAATKRAGELLCHSEHHLSGLSVMCLRFFSVYGPRQWYSRVSPSRIQLDRPSLLTRCSRDRSAARELLPHLLPKRHARGYRRATTL